MSIIRRAKGSHRTTLAKIGAIERLLDLLDNADPGSTIAEYTSQALLNLSSLKENQWIVYYKSEMNDLDKYYKQITEIAAEKVFENQFAIIYKTNSELKNYGTYNFDNPWVGNSKEDLYWLKESYPKEYNIYINFLQKYGVKV